LKLPRTTEISGRVGVLVLSEMVVLTFDE
jgi:hypothetical protein